MYHTNVNFMIWIKWMDYVIYMNDGLALLGSLLLLGWMAVYLPSWYKYYEVGPFYTWGLR